MTPGHKHRTVKVARDGLIHRALTYPLVTSTDLRRVTESPYPWGPLPKREPISRGPGKKPYPVPPQPDRYYLSGLSILHRWTGLTIWVPDEEER